MYVVSFRGEETRRAEDREGVKEMCVCVCVFKLDAPRVRLNTPLPPVSGERKNQALQRTYF